MSDLLLVTLLCIAVAFVILLLVAGILAWKVYRSR
jgi:hypothetical protein